MTGENCVRCGDSLHCGKAAGEASCWCAGLPAVMPVNDEGCLCRRCLTAAIAERVTGSSSPEAAAAVARAGLCAGCAHARELKSPAGSGFTLCGLAESDPSLPKYPRLPVLRCAGWRR